MPVAGFSIREAQSAAAAPHQGPSRDQGGAGRGCGADRGGGIRAKAAGATTGGEAAQAVNQASSLSTSQAKPGLLLPGFFQTSASFRKPGACLASPSMSRGGKN